MRRRPCHYIWCQLFCARVQGIKVYILSINKYWRRISGWWNCCLSFHGLKETFLQFRTGGKVLIVADLYQVAYAQNWIEKWPRTKIFMKFLEVKTGQRKVISDFRFTFGTAHTNITVSHASDARCVHWWRHIIVNSVEC